MQQESRGQVYRGRFAPSPSGSLHFGSLIAALGSYLQARSQNGKWLVRMEDLDPPREMPGAETLILNSLEAHGLLWDEEVLYQSHRHPAYESALEFLGSKDLLFYCDCTNKQLREQISKSARNKSILTSGVYPGNCRQFTKHRDNCAIRIRVTDQTILFHDQVYGLVSQDLATEVGDFVVKRRDGLYTYQLAVVVDDIEQGITEIVRGVDLLDSTPRQLYLYQCLEAQPPSYAHLPLALMPDKKKLSKQTGATAIDDSLAAGNLFQAMQFLGLKPTRELEKESVETLLDWGIQNWNLSKVSTQDVVI